MERKLFCQISPFCYRISVEKEIFLRNLRDLFSSVRFAVKQNRCRRLLRGTVLPCCGSSMA